MCLFVKIFNKLGDTCVDSFCKKVYIDRSHASGIQFSEFEQKIQIIPNPATDYILVKGFVRNDNFGLYNMLGQLVFTTALFDEKVMIPTDIPNGFYSVFIIRNGKRYVDKIFINRSQ
ncbi:MAG: T9SS type A sorting domain-containing protein [Chitinophagaceae bacterium]|nr:T9SS type A sorting domain-containing protein [Chitinophagaceae bacterium]